MTGSIPLMARVAKIMIIMIIGAYIGVMTLAKGHLFTRLLDTSHAMMIEKKAEQSLSIGKPAARIDSLVSLVD
jgi:hypothetical protein